MDLDETMETKIEAARTWDEGEMMMEQQLERMGESDIFV